VDGRATQRVAACWVALALLAGEVQAQSSPPAVSGNPIKLNKNADKTRATPGCVRLKPAKSSTVSMRRLVELRRVITPKAPSVMAPYATR